MKLNTPHFLITLFLTACDPTSAPETSIEEQQQQQSSEHAELLQRVADLEADRQALQDTLDRVNEVLRYVSVTDEGDVRVNGANLIVTNGENATQWVNGKGNVILGYDSKTRSYATRSGSHNLVVGDGHEYLGHSGIVAGMGCRIEGAAAIAIGEGNRASSFATALGGKWKEASEPHTVR